MGEEKDYKRYKHDVEKIKLLESIVKMLENEQEIPSRFRPHPLTGNYQGCRECHVGNDFHTLLPAKTIAKQIISEIHP